MKAAVLRAPGRLVIEERPEPTPGPGEVLARIAEVGVCGSDVHYWHEGGLGARRVTGPLILGHETAGEVVALGPGADRLRVGDRVVLEPGVPCGQCVFCRRGEYNLCQDIRFMATPPVDGCLCEFVAWPQDWCYPMPDGMSYAAGALIEPAAVAVFALHLAALRPAASVAILGSSTIGLLTLQCARLAGAGKVIVTDVIPERLERARRFGADAVVDARGEDVPARIAALTDGLGADVVFEAAGAEATMQQCVNCARPGGDIVVIGICPQDVLPINLGDARRRAVRLQFVRRYRHVFPDAIDLAASGRLQLEPLVTHRFPLERVTEAFETALAGGGDVLKVVVEVSRPG